MGRLITTSVLIAAPAWRIWSILMDFDAYPSWNPFIHALKGDAHVGSRLEAVIAPPGSKPQTFRPVVLDAVPNRVFAWKGSLPVPGLFTGEHRFSLADEGAGTRFTHSEAFFGLLVPFVSGILSATESGFQAMNEALKARAEAR